MRHKQQTIVTKGTKDFGKDLYDTVVFLIILLGVLYYFHF